MEKTFFANVQGVGRMVNSEGDYDQYHVRTGLRAERYEHSDSIVKKSFKGIVNGKSAKEQALAFVEEARKTFEPKAAKAAEKKGRAK
jgi:hypothetical protein